MYHEDLHYQIFEDGAEECHQWVAWKVVGKPKVMTNP
jgi:hypothetical protein